MEQHKKFLEQKITEEDELMKPFKEQLEEIKKTVADIEKRVASCNSRKFAYTQALEDVDIRLAELHGAT